MALNIKVRDGTPNGSTKDLCRSCRHATIAKSFDGREVRTCDELRLLRIPFEVAECSSYSDRSTPTRREMYATAWILRTDEKRVIGFVNPREWGRLVRDGKEEEN